MNKNKNKATVGSILGRFDLDNEKKSLEENNKRDIKYNDSKGINTEESNKGENFIPSKKTISELIKTQGSSARVADSIRIHPVLSSALVYWTTIIDDSKSKPDIVEQALLKVIPEEYLIQGYEIAKKKNKI